MKTVVLFFVCVVVFFSCKKPIKPFAQPPSKCPEMYDVRSELLDLLKHDTINQGGVIGTSDVIDDTLYYFVKVNPNNPYEIIFIKRINGMSWNLNKYNFCKNETTLLSTNVSPYTIDWSSKDWILFLKGGGPQFCKIKSNGDSLTPLPYIPNNEGSQLALWNPSGSSYIDYKGHLFNENGNPIDTINFQGTMLGWFDDNNILLSSSDNVLKTNVNTSSQELFFTGQYFSYDKVLDCFFSRKDSSGYSKWIVTYRNGNIIEHPYHLEHGIFMKPKFGAENKILMELDTREYYFGSSTMLLYKKQIAIMNMDGSNVRTVNIPE